MFYSNRRRCTVADVHIKSDEYSLGLPSRARQAHVNVSEALRLEANDVTAVPAARTSPGMQMSAGFNLARAAKARFDISFTRTTLGEAFGRGRAEQEGKGDV